MHADRGMVSFHRVLELIAGFDLQRLANLPWNCCLSFPGDRGMGHESLLTSYLFLTSLLCLTRPLAGKDSRGIFTRYHLPFPKTAAKMAALRNRSEEHTSELQSHLNLVCRLLLEKKKKKTTSNSDNGLQP